MEPIEIGSIVKSLTGRDKDGLFAVIGTVQSPDGKRFLLLADGHHHRLEKPKKKNPIHLQTMRVAEPTLMQALEDNALSDKVLREVIRALQFHA